MATIDAAGAFDNAVTANGDQTDPVPANNTDNTGNGGTADAVYTGMLPSGDRGLPAGLVQDIRRIPTPFKGFQTG